MSEKMIFCLGEGKYQSSGIGYQKNLMMFNKPVSEEVYNQTKSALSVKNFKLPLTKWFEIGEIDIPTQTQKDLGGKLKTLSYQDAWAKMWETLSQEDKNFFQTLPNFTWEVFTSITGIEPENVMDSKIEDIEIIN